MKKNILEFEPSFDFSLLAIVTPLRGYRLCWWLEQKNKLVLQRSEDLVLNSKPKKTEMFFQVFHSLPETDEFRQFTLLGNKASNGFLIPEQKVVDFYLKMDGEFDTKDIESVKSTLMSIPSVQYCFTVDPHSLQSRQNLLL